ncbi:MAG: hypothetical protein Q9212_004226 [Teloschistes hypoglaucus]
MAHSMEDAKKGRKAMWPCARTRQRAGNLMSVSFDAAGESQDIASCLDRGMEAATVRSHAFHDQSQLPPDFSASHGPIRAMVWFSDEKLQRVRSQVRGSRNACHSKRVDGDRICRSGEQKGRRGKPFAHQSVNVFVKTKLK